MRRILVIRLGAFGDFVQSFGPFAAIRAAHPDDEITLLTAAPFAAMGRAAPWFDRVEVDARPGWWNIPGLLRLRRQLQGFDLVYDLQTSGRSSRYFALAGRPAWSGIAAGCPLPHDNPKRNDMHTRERQVDQLRRAGIAEFPDPALDWLPPATQDLPARYALFAPGAAAHRPGKRWPPEQYGLLGRLLVERGVTPVVIGVKGEADLAEIVALFCPGAVDLTGKTAAGEVFALARGAEVAVGNDTGPMHLAALSGTPCVVLFGPESDPALTAPRGPKGEWLTIVRADDLNQLQADEVFGRVEAVLRR